MQRKRQGKVIYAELKKGAGLKFAASGNESGDEQIELDIIADEAFIPSGAIFGVFKDADVAEDFNGSNIISGGFFVFGMNLEAYFADGPDVYKGIFDQETGKWSVIALTDPMPSADILAINGSNQLVWDEWLQSHVLSLLDTKGGTVKPH